MSRVIISAGHTNNNPGSTANGLREVDLTRQISKAILPHLRSNGVLTLSVPPEMDVVQKITWINNTGYKEEFNDVCVEIHINEADGTQTGIEGWYKENGQNKSQQLTEKLLQSITTDTGLKNNGSKSEYMHELGGLAFVHNTTLISSLIEIGYIDNPQDADFLKKTENIEKIGKSIAKGIMQFLGLEYKEIKPMISAATPQISTVPVQTTQPTSTAMPNIPVRPSTPPSFPTPPSSLGVPPTSTTAPNSFIASREERKEMIKRNYIKILGREPNQSDLNYFLNTGIIEDQLIKRMIDSQEHADLVKSRQEILDIKTKFQSLQAELIQLRTETKDKTEMINNLNNLLTQKNISLTELHRRLMYYERGPNSKPAETPNTPEQPAQLVSEENYGNSFMDRIFKFFSDRLG